MNAVPAKHRVTGALTLAPMTVGTLSRCLSLSPSSVRRVLDELHSLRRVTRYRVHQRAGRMGAPSYVYERRV